MRGDPGEDDWPRTQQTPQGAEIPVPTREEFLRKMDKVAPPLTPPTRGPEDDRDAPRE